jgi:glutamine synthetase
VNDIKTEADVSKFIHDQGIEFVSVRFCDLLGQEQHFTIPSDQLMGEAFSRGLFFDGSSIIGFQKINNSDMKLVPNVDTCYVDPFRTHKTLDMYFDVVTPVTSEPYSRDPRQVAKKAEAYLKYTGIADTAYFGVEPEFFMFDTARYDTSMKGSFYSIDTTEAHWNSGARADSVNTPDTPNRGYKMREGGGYFPVPPLDHSQDVRDQMVENLMKCGLKLERAHHEVAEGQQEINYRFNDLLHAADDLQTYKYVVRETAREFGKVVTFMPKPMAGENGTGMHCHQSLWKDGKPLFYSDEGYAGLSDLCRWYIGGLIKHAGSVLAFTNPTTNSYRRLVPGYEAPVDLVYSARNRSAAIRIPLAGNKPSEKRLEFRVPDTTCNPYLGLSAEMMAGLDGIQNRIDPPKPIDKNLYELPPEQAKGIKTVPTSLSAALDCLEADHDFLMQGDVFTQDLLDTWVSIKRNEISRQQIVPTPMEYEMYFNY